MRSIPVNTDRVGLFQAISIEAKNRDGVQSTTPEGLPVWKLQVLLTPADGSKASLEEISIPAQNSPNIPPLTAVKFKDLTARHWEMNGRSGVSLSAEGVYADKPAA